MPTYEFRMWSYIFVRRTSEYLIFNFQSAVLDIPCFNPSFNVVCDLAHVLILGFCKKILENISEDREVASKINTYLRVLVDDIDGWSFFLVDEIL